MRNVFFVLLERRNVGIPLRHAIVWTYHSRANFAFLSRLCMCLVLF